MTALRFAAIGINHGHIYAQVDCLLDAGAEFVCFHAPEDDLAAAFAEQYPQADAHRRQAPHPRGQQHRPGRELRRSAASAPRSASRSMRHGKDYMVDKPGITSLDQLAEVRKVQAETRRIYLDLLFASTSRPRSTVKAGELVHGGAIGRVVNTVGLGPHRLADLPRPAWFFERARYGGILTDIASHQCEQFLFFAGAQHGARSSRATVANRANPQTPELQDFGEMLVRADGRHRLHPRRLVHARGPADLGRRAADHPRHQGYIELRKYVDIAGAPGTITCSWSTARACSASTAPMSSCPMGAS